MINSAEVNTFLSWFSCVLLPLFLLWHSGILLLKENSEGCILWIKICVRKGEKIERKRRKGIKRSFEVDTAKILIQSLLLFSDSVQIFGAFLRNQWDCGTSGTFTKAFDMLVKKRPEKQRWSHPLLELRSTGPFRWPGEGGVMKLRWWREVLNSLEKTYPKERGLLRRSWKSLWRRMVLWLGCLCSPRKFICRDPNLKMTV